MHDKINIDTKSNANTNTNTSSNADVDANTNESAHSVGTVAPLDDGQGQVGHDWRHVEGVAPGCKRGCFHAGLHAKYIVRR